MNIWIVHTKIPWTEKGLNPKFFESFESFLLIAYSEKTLTPHLTKIPLSLY